MMILLRVFLVFELLVLFLSSLLALFHNFLLEFVTLSSHCCFRDSHTRSLDKDAIYRNVHSCPNLDHITNNDVIILNWILLSVSETNDDVILVTDSLEFQKLKLLLVVIP